MRTLQSNKSLVSLLVIVSFLWSGWFLFNWLALNPAAREIIAECAVFFIAAALVAIELYTRLSGWNEERATRPVRKGNTN